MNSYPPFQIKEQMNMVVQPKIATDSSVKSLKRIQQVWDGPLIVRVSAKDYQEEGLDIEDYVVFSQMDERTRN